EEDIGIEFVSKIFAHTTRVVDGKFTKIPPKYMPYDKIDIPIGRFAGNKKVIHATLGMFLYFKFFFENELAGLVNIEDYLDLPGITADTISEFESKISNATLTGK
ncbi:hypothetical protein V6O07_17235, partial [Arthrospira platensis SPKY2]